MRICPCVFAQYYLTIQTRFQVHLIKIHVGPWYGPNKRHHNRILSFCYEYITPIQPFWRRALQLEFQHRKRGHCSCGQFSPWQAVSLSQLALERFCRVLRTTLSRDVSRVNTGAHTRGRAAQRLHAVSCIALSLSPSLFLPLFPSASLVCGERWTVSRTNQQEVGSRVRRVLRARDAYQP